MDWIVTALLGATITILILYWKLVAPINYWKNRGIPYIKSWPLFGNSLDMVLMRKTFGENLSDLYHRLEGERFGGVMQFTRPALIVRDPELISHVLIKDFTHFHDRGYTMNEKLEPLSASLVNLTGDQWRQVRHKLTPTFTSNKLKIMFSQIVECSDDALNYLKDKKDAIEVKQYMQKFNLNVIGLVAFGLNVDAFSEKNERGNMFVHLSTRAFTPSLKTLGNFLFRLALPKLGDWLKVRLMEPMVADFFHKLVQDTIEHREKTNTRRNDFIQLMLDLKEQEKSKLSDPNSLNMKNKPLSNNGEDHVDEEDRELLEQLRNAPLQTESTTQVFTDNCIAAQSFLFISGGSETTAAVLTFALYELAVNPDVQKKVRKEVESVLSRQEFNYRSVKDMVYLEQFINEVLRLHQPGGGLGRVCTEDFILPGTDKVIEKGVLINIPVMALHKNPNYFPDPEKFNPDRFQNMDDIPRGVFLPFGGGPRICIAMRFAMLEMKIYLAKLVQKYYLTLSDKTQLPLQMSRNTLVLNAVGGIWVKFEERH